MALYTPTVGDVIEFKHLSAAVKVLVTYTTENNLTLDSVTVSSASYKLSGTAIVTLNPASNPYPAIGTEDAAISNSVTVTFREPVVLSANHGDTIEVQVPIRPIGADDLQIEVFAHRSGDAIDINGVPAVNTTVAYHFDNTASSGALDRNYMLTAKIRIQPSTPFTVIDNSLFSVSNSKKVRFSKGNLKQNGSSWSLHENQYDRSATQSDAECDLFQ